MNKEEFYTAAENGDLETIKLYIEQGQDSQYDSYSYSLADIALSKAKDFATAKYIIENGSITVNSFDRVMDFEAKGTILLPEKFRQEWKEYILNNRYLDGFHIIKGLPNVYITNDLLIHTTWVLSHPSGNLPRTITRAEEILTYFTDNPDTYNGNWIQILEEIPRMNMKVKKAILKNKNNQPYNYALNYVIEKIPEYENTELIKYLIKLEADPNLALPNLPAPFNITPLRVTIDNMGSNALLCLLNNGANPNISNKNELPYLYYLLDALGQEIKQLRIAGYITKCLLFLSTALKHGADPFITIYTDEYPDGIPLFYDFFMKFGLTAYLSSASHKYTEILLQYILDTISLFTDNFNVTDQWGMNLLHHVIKFNVLHNKKRSYITADINRLVRLGINPNHRALIDDEQKVVAAKMNGTLPPEYGKTPREMLKAIVND